ncbi:MAG TPA: hypothetical protein VNZ86_06975 [Bacteroidia bacterium]|jgi:hypothetical protein|nr:hypothetical protein [Bacteroidia bacterium]
MKTFSLIALFVLSLGFAGNLQAAPPRYYPHAYHCGYRPYFRPAVVIAPAAYVEPVSYYSYPTAYYPGAYVSGAYFPYDHHRRGRCCGERREFRECHRHGYYGRR